MRPFLTGVLALLLAAAVLAAQNPPVPVAPPQISGRVLDASNGAPLRRARVIITAAGRAGDPVFTDDDGRFVAANAGRTVTVTISKAGYTRVVVTPPAAQSAGPLQLALARSVAVMGRVVDRSGSPPFTAYVAARLISTAPGGSAGAPTRIYTRTDQLGGYRLGDLAAGRYEITAIRSQLLELGGTALEEQLFGTRDSFDVARAVTVSLAVGDELRDVDFTVPGSSRSCGTAPAKPGSQKGTGRIRGRISGPAGEPLFCAQVHVSSAAAAGSGSLTFV